MFVRQIAAYLRDFFFFRQHCSKRTIWAAKQNGEEFKHVRDTTDEVWADRLVFANVFTIRYVRNTGRSFHFGRSIKVTFTLDWKALNHLRGSSGACMSQTNMVILQGPPGLNDFSILFPLKVFLSSKPLGEMRNEKLRQIIYIGLMHSIAAGAQKYKVGVTSQETPCYSERTEEWPFIRSCRRRKNLADKSANNLRDLFSQYRRSVCRGRDGELFSSPGGAEHVRVRQHQRGPPLTMDPGHGFKIATRSPAGTHNPAPKPENTHRITHSSAELKFISWGVNVRSNDQLSDLMFNMFILYKSITYFYCVNLHVYKAGATCR